MFEVDSRFDRDLSGLVLDRYRLGRCLGSGGMGAVLEAEHTVLGRKVAVKILHPLTTHRRTARRRFVREAKAAARIEHDNVLEVLDFGETRDGRVYLVMELLEGRDLGRLLEQHSSLPWARTRDIIRQVVDAMAAVHAAGFMHRDIKPSNCFLTGGSDDQGARRDFVKLLDFGIAKQFDCSEMTDSLTRTDELFGTAAYMAPEMAMGVTNDPRSDIYAVGIMMYRMLAGELPFTGDTPFQILQRHVNQPPPRLRHKIPSLPRELEDLVEYALMKDPNARIPSMEAFSDLLARDFESAEASAETSARASARAGAETTITQTRPRIGSRETEQPSTRVLHAASPSTTTESSRLVGSFDVEFEPPNLVKLTVVGSVDEIAANEIIDRLTPMIHHEPHWLLLLDARRFEYGDAGARKAGTERLKSLPDYSLASFGGGRTQRTVVSLFAKFTELVFRGRDVRHRFFGDEAAARAWLQEESRRRSP